jgi:dienelactone hydrolase
MSQPQIPAHEAPWKEAYQHPPARIPASATRPLPLLFDAEHRAITGLDAWARRREELRRAWEKYLGVIAGPRPASRIEVLEEDRPEGAVRQLIRYEAERGLPVEGYLLRPDRPGEARPGVVVLHSTAEWTIRQPAGLEGAPALHLGLQLARRSYVAICPRCFLWQYRRDGRLETAVDWLRGRHPGVTGMAKMLYDATRAVDLLASMDDVDAGRIGAIGHSLGAKEVLYLAAFDERVRAAVSSEGGIGLSYSNWDAPWYLGPGIKRPDFGLDHGQVLALVAPRGFLLIGGDSADGDRSWPYISEAIPVWKVGGAPRAVGLFNHRAGHAYPPEARSAAEAWLDGFLKPAGA